MHIQTHILSGWCIASFVLFLALFHLHLLLDYYGSGPEWHIHYLWPMKAMIIRNPHAWEFYSWQNMLAFAVFLLWTSWIGWKKKRTPLECIMPKLDAQLVGGKELATNRTNGHE